MSTVPREVNSVVSLRPKLFLFYQIRNLKSQMRSKLKVKTERMTRNLNKLHLQTIRMNPKPKSRLQAVRPPASPASSAGRKTAPSHRATSNSTRMS